MKLIAILLLASSMAWGQTDKPNVTVTKMTDAEFKQLDDAELAMQKAAEAYLKAADEYAATKSKVLGKYNATESNDCHISKIVDIRGQYIIVEVRPLGSYGLGNSCGIMYTPSLIVNQ